MRHYSFVRSSDWFPLVASLARSLNQPFPTIPTYTTLKPKPKSGKNIVQKPYVENLNIPRHHQINQLIILGASVWLDCAHSSGHSGVSSPTHTSPSLRLPRSIPLTNRQTVRRHWQAGYRYPAPPPPPPTTTSAIASAQSHIIRCLYQLGLARRLIHLSTPHFATPPPLSLSFEYK